MLRQFGKSFAQKTITSPPSMANDLRFEQHRSQDLQAHAAALSPWRLDYQQLSPGRFKGVIQRAGLPGLAVLREQSPFALRRQGVLQELAYSFFMPIRPCGPVYFHGQRAPEHSIFSGRADAVDLITLGPTRLVAIVVERELLKPLWQSLYHKPLAAWLEQARVLDTQAAKSRYLLRLHQTVLQQLAAPSRPIPEAIQRRWRDDLLLEWIEALPAQVNARSVYKPQQRKKLVDRACDWFLARSDSPPTLLQLCTVIGVSRRQLDYCFQDALGIAPAQYLRWVRLNKVRQALCSTEAQQTVRDVATRWGFWHLSQFAQDYRNAFGELPSATLAVRRKLSARTSSTNHNHR